MGEFDGLCAEPGCGLGLQTRVHEIDNPRGHSFVSPAGREPAPQVSRESDGTPIMCDTPGCGKPIPPGGEGHPEICPDCLKAEQALGNARLAALAGRQDVHDTGARQIMQALERLAHRVDALDKDVATLKEIIRPAPPPPEAEDV
jgi:hypothetical protein